MSARGDAPPDAADRTDDPVARAISRLREGIPPRTSVEVTVDGRTFFVVSARFIRCAGCGLVVPQSRTRIAEEARALWLRDHVRCRKGA